MSQYRVTFQQLQSAIDQLTNLNSQFGTAVENLNATETQLSAMWEGQARDNFHTAFQNDKAQMDNFKKAIQEYITVLQGSLSQYTRAEQNNTSIASTRTYN